MGAEPSDVESSSSRVLVDTVTALLTRNVTGEAKWWWHDAPCWDWTITGRRPDTFTSACIRLRLGGRVLSCDGRITSFDLRHRRSATGQQRGRARLIVGSPRH